MNLAWLKSIDFGFREHLQPISGRAPLTASSLLRLSHASHAFKRETPKPVAPQSRRSGTKADAKRQTLMLIPSKTIALGQLTLPSEKARGSVIKR